MASADNNADGEFEAASDAVINKNECQRCGMTVSDQFRRVFGDNDNIVHACQNCTSSREQFEGATATSGYVPDEVERGHSTMDEVTQE